MKLRRSFLICFSLLMGAFAAAAPGATAVAAPAPDPALLVPIDRLVGAANAGSVTGTRAAYVAAPTIVDDFAPFAWTGVDAVPRWTRDLALVIKQYGITHGRFAHHAPRYVHVAGKRAWLVVPSEFDFALKGRPQRVASAWTFVLSKAGGGWRIESSTWATTSSTLE